MTVIEKLRQQILSNLGVSQAEFESWKTKDYVTSKEVVQTFIDLAKNADKIWIFGDYDCDGICASYIMAKELKALTGLDVSIHLPKRFSEGYGMKENQIDVIYEQEDKQLLNEGKNVLIVTVDNGIASFPAIKKAKEYGYQVIVTDHHELGNNTVPDADLVIDPKVDGHNPFDVSSTTPFNGYCGAGVAYKIAEQFIEDEALLYELKCFAALATIADVMSLREENHTLVKEVLDAMRAGQVPKPIQLLGEAKQFDFSTIVEKDFGFTFGPMFNACGRLYDDGAEVVYKYLMQPTKEMAEQIVETNETRKDIVKSEYETIQKTIEHHNFDVFQPLIVYVPSLHEGIVGILAGKITEDYGVPSIVLTDTEDKKIVKGSARSVEGFSIFNYLCDIHTSHPEFFVGFGGHDGAAGLSVHKDKLKQLKQYSLSLSFERPASFLQKNVLQISKDQIPVVYNTMREYAPFGEGNPDIIVRALFHKFYDKAFMVGKNKDTLLINKGDYKVVSYSCELPKKNMFWVEGPLEKSSYNGNSTICLHATDVYTYEKTKKMENSYEAKEDTSEFIDSDYEETQSVEMVYEE